MKCEKCNEAEATVFYSTISGKFKATRKRYCRKCTEAEQIRLAVPPAQQVTSPPQTPQSLIELVQGEMAKHNGQAPAGEKAGEPPEKKVKMLEQKMQIAIGKEQYEEAARIRDEIAALKRPKPEGDKQQPTSQPKQ